MVFGLPNKDYYIPYYAKFIDEDVRIVVINNQRYMVVKDMFRALGRLTSENKINSDDRNNLKTFLINLDEYNKKYLKNKVIICGERKTTPTSESKSKARKSQKVDLININVVPIVLTKFEPTKKSKDYDVKLNIWCKFMKFVNSILQDYQLENYIIQDKEDWKENTRELEEMGLDPVIVNKHININMAKAIGVYHQGIKEITKEELKIYESQTTMDLLAVRQELYVKYKEVYNLFNSKEMAIKGSLNFIIDKYKLKIEKEIIKK